MLQEGKGPINFTVFLTLFGEKLNGEPGAGLESLAGQQVCTPPGPGLNPTQSQSRPHLALAHPEDVGPTSAFHEHRSPQDSGLGSMPSLSLPNPQSQPPGQAWHFRKTANPSVSEPKGALCIGHPLPAFCDLEGSLPHSGFLLGGAGKLAVWVLTWIPWPPRDRP